MNTKEVKNRIKRLKKELKTCRSFTAIDRLNNEIEVLKRYFLRYDFTFRKTEVSPIEIYKTVDCQHPQKTKAYKELKQMFNELKIYSYGYSIALPF